MSTTTEPLYYLQVIDRDGKPVLSAMRPLKARHGSVDLPLIETCLEEILKRLDFNDIANSEPFIWACIEEAETRGTGFWRTQTHVRQAMYDGIIAALRRASLRTLPVGAAIREGMAAAIQRLKDETTLLA